MATMNDPAANNAATGDDTGAVHADCVDRPEAEDIVEQCCADAGSPGPHDFHQKLGELFPGELRLQFCACVSSKSGVANVPCGADTTLEQVVSSISC